MLLDSAVWVGYYIHLLLNDYGGSTEDNLLGFGLTIAAMYGLLNNFGWAMNVVKVLYAYALIGGLSGAFLSVEQAKSLWNVDRTKIKPSPLEETMMRNQGYNLLNLALMGYTLVFEEKDILTATGRTAAATLLFFAKAFLANEIPDEQKKNPGPYIWMALNAIVACSLLLA